MPLAANLHDLPPEMLDDQNFGRTDCIVFLCYFNEIGKLTPENLDDAFFRIRTYETFFGPLCTNNKRIEKSELAARLGLRLNIASATKAAWWNSLRDKIKDRAERNAAPFDLET